MRANGEIQNKILEKMGVKEILSPEGEVSNAVAENLINPHVLMSVKLPDDYQIIEVKSPKGIAGRSLTEIGLREKYKINLVTLLALGRAGRAACGIHGRECVARKSPYNRSAGRQYEDRTVRHIAPFRNVQKHTAFYRD